MSSIPDLPDEDEAILIELEAFGVTADLLAPGADRGAPDAAATYQCWGCDNPFSSQLVNVDGLFLCPECLMCLMLWQSDYDQEADNEGGIWE